MIIKWCLILLLLLLAAGCEEEAGPEGPAPDPFAVAAGQLPARLNLSRPQFYSVSYRVTHPNGLADIAAVSLLVYRADQTSLLATIPLLDDGGNIDPAAGDVIAGDGIFANRIFSDSTVFPPGDLAMRAQVQDIDGDQVNSAFQNVTAQLNSAPQLLGTSAPDTLPAGSPALTFAVLVRDEDGIDDVNRVLLRLKDAAGTLVLQTLELARQPGGDAEQADYAISLDSTFAAERHGSYQLDFQAEDLAGEVSVSPLIPLFLENTPPNLFNVQLPDTVQLPATGSDTLVVRVSAGDSQGLGDLDKVEVTILRAGGTPAVIELFDDGDFENSRDELAGDGIYSRGLLLLPTNTSGTFSFTFTALDRVGNPAASLVKTLVILPQPGRISPNTDDWRSIE